jgi:hypothetical protein
MHISHSLKIAIGFKPENIFLIYLIRIIDCKPLGAILFDDQVPCFGTCRNSPSTNPCSNHLAGNLHLNEFLPIPARYRRTDKDTTNRVMPSQVRQFIK